MAFQIQGFTSANIMEVEASRAARATLRAESAALGHYRLSSATGIMAAGFTAFSAIFQFRWGNNTAVALIKRIAVSMSVDTVVLPAGVSGMDLFVARNFTADGTGGSVITPTGNLNKLRTSMNTSLVSSVRVATTTNLTAGTHTLDKMALGCFTAGNGEATIGKTLIPTNPIFEARHGEFPLILEGNEGFVIQAYTGATGTWKAAVTVDWAEVSDITPYL